MTYNSEKLMLNNLQPKDNLIKKNLHILMYSTIFANFNKKH